MGLRAMPYPLSPSGSTPFNPQQTAPTVKTSVDIWPSSSIIARDGQPTGQEPETYDTSYSRPSVPQGSLMNEHTFSVGKGHAFPPQVDSYTSPARRSDEITTRSGRRVSKSALPGRPPGVREGRVRKNKAKAHRQRKPVTRLTRALSEIATECSGIPVIDAGTFACRSIEERREEVKAGGRIKRPLNAFILYRKAYQEVAKTQCSNDNHQDVSTVCGISWRQLEPPRIRDRFENLAKIEKEKHAEAHPGYKYIPVSNKKPKRNITPGSDVSGGRIGPGPAARHERTPDLLQPNGNRYSSPIYDVYVSGDGCPVIMETSGVQSDGTWSTPNRVQHSQYYDPLVHGGHPLLCGSTSLDRLEPQMNPPQEFTYPDPTINNHLPPMTSSNDPYFPAYGLSTVPWNGLSAGLTFPESQYTCSWQTQHHGNPVPQWSLLGTEHDSYLGDQNDWTVEDLDPRRLDEFYANV